MHNHNCFFSYNLNAYRKIKACFESLYEINDAELFISSLNKVYSMIKIVENNNEISLARMREKVFGFNIFKWRQNYTSFRACEDLSRDILLELYNIHNNMLIEYNNAIENAQKSEMESYYYKNNTIGFKTPPKKRKRRKKE